MSRSRAATWLAAAFLATVALAGCGDDNEGSDTPQEAVDAATDFATAYIQGDGAQACDLMTSDYRKAFVARATRAVESIGQDATGFSTCPKAIEAGSAVRYSQASAVPQADRGAGKQRMQDDLDALEAGGWADGFSVDGNKAQVQDVPGLENFTLTLTDNGGEWLVSEIVRG